ncbi:MAG: selenium-dependent molybdenum cofactor biosynthesis protein YqeB [Anaerolineae bacterium]
MVIRGAGDLATGVAHRLWRAGFRVVMTEIAQPRALRRAVSLASAVYDGVATVEGLTARRAADPDDVARILAAGEVPVLVDPTLRLALALAPEVVVDAILAKRNLGTSLHHAPIVIGLGPGFVAGRDVHLVIETQRGHDLGKVIAQGSAAPDTGVPEPVQGHARERVLWAPASGVLYARSSIGDRVEAGQMVAEMDGAPVLAGVSGVLRGILHDGLAARAGEKVGDVDPRGIRAYCFTISDKARAIGGGVLEAILYARR